MRRDSVCAIFILTLTIFVYISSGCRSENFGIVQLKSIRDIENQSIQIKNLTYYCLTLPNEKRVAHIQKEFNGLNIEFVNPPLIKNEVVTRHSSGASGFCKMIDLGLRAQDKFKPFQPFVIMEDDSSKYREFPEMISIPKDADLVYLGLSVFTPNDNTIYFERTTNPEIHRVYGMSASHMIVVCSATGANLVTRVTIEDGLNDTFADILLGMTHPFYNIYALSVPLVYQDASVGGHESGTKWDFPSKKIDNVIEAFPLNAKTEESKKNSIAYQVSK